MPLPTNPNFPADKKSLPTQPATPVAPTTAPTPVQPAGETEKQRVILQPGEGNIKANIADIGKKEEVKIVKAVRTAKGKLTSEDILTKDYNTFLKPVEKKIVELLDTARERFSQLGADELFAEARKQRGDAYQEQSYNIGDYLFAKITKDNIVRPEDAPKVIQAVINEMIGMGPIEPLWQNPNISEIMVNGPYDIKVELNGKIVDVPGAKFRDAKHLLELCQKILQDVGREVNASRPTADGRLPDYSRINVVAQNIAPEGPFLTIRRFPDTIFTVEELVKKNALTEEIALEIGNLVYKGCSMIVSGSTGSGKQLSHDTVIPTPTGMTTMGDLQVGEYVLDENGEPTLVTAKYSNKVPVAYEMTFSDGTKVVADEDHNWFTSTNFNENAEVRTTKDIFNTMSENHAVSVMSAPVAYSEKNLLTEPDVFGASLYGQTVIPTEYLYSSVKQREEFLKGVLGKDIIPAEGKIVLPNATKNILTGVRQIFHSLTFQTTLQGSTISYNTNSHRYIVDVQPVASVPMSCITVDSENHLYLATDAFITTHNTSMLNALSGCIPADERVITIEDNLELRLNPSKHILAMETKQKGAGSTDVGVVTIRDLVKNALRMRPDRIIVGEVRDEAAYDMLQAMNTGHDGSMTTVHANDPEGAIDRLTNLISQVGDFSPERALSLLANGVDIIVQVERYEDGSRRVSKIAELPSKLESKGRIITLEPRILWEFQQTGTEFRLDNEGNEKEYIVGEYVRVNELSEATVRKHRLDKKASLNLKELFEVSSIPKDEILGKLFDNEDADS